MLQPKLNLKVSQRQVLTPGLVQMVSVLALNKLELKEMINTEIIENPVLEEVEHSSATLEELAGREGDLERSAADLIAAPERVEKDPFEEIDFGSYFQDYLDPGFRTASSFEELDRPSFDNFLSQPSTLTDHLMWQLGALNLAESVRLAAELIIGNLDEEGYLAATNEELALALLQARLPAPPPPIPFERGIRHQTPVAQMLAAGRVELSAAAAAGDAANGGSTPGSYTNGHGSSERNGQAGADETIPEELAAALRAVAHALDVVRQFDPLGVGTRDLRECLLVQIAGQRREAELVAARRAAWHKGHAADLASEGLDPAADYGPALRTAEVSRPASGCTGDTFEIASHIVANHLGLLQKKDMRELTRSCGRSAEDVQAAVEFIRTLDPRPGRRYNQSETRLIEPDVAFVKRDGEYVVVMNEEEMPTLRLSRAYRRLLREKKTEKDVREYVKERYKSAIQLLRNIEQRKNTIVRTCDVIVRRQTEFLERGEQGLKPMMIKEVAEEIGVHPSTVSRAVANKYVHTPQGVYELRFFFTEAVNGPEGGDLPLVLLKRKVKKLIEEENPRKPFTDDQLAAELQRQGIQVTRRTVAKYREDMQIPSTHQRRVR
ncbi:MAG: RNA polymerase factor sigma-54 [Acidobacteriota bacterium]|nr:RNA polymerase factor sigma-54 [Acidobacteriota bacterium]